MSSDIDYSAPTKKVKEAEKVDLTAIGIPGELVDEFKWLLSQNRIEDAVFMKRCMTWASSGNKLERWQLDRLQTFDTQYEEASKKT